MKPPARTVSFTMNKSTVDADTIKKMTTDFAESCAISTKGKFGENSAVPQPVSLVFNSMYETDDGAVDYTWFYNDPFSAQLTKIENLKIPDKKRQLSMSGYVFQMKISEINSQTSNAKAILMKHTDGTLGIAVFIFNSHERWGADMDMFVAICQERWGECGSRNNAFVHIWNNIVESGNFIATQVYFYELPDQTATYTSVVKDASGEDNELVSSVYISPGGKFQFHCCMSS